MSSQAYLLADQPSELERLQLQSRVWEPSGRRLLDEIGEGRGARVLDVGCGAIGWLRLLSEWVGPAGEVVGADIDEAMLAAAGQFVDTEGLGNVVLMKDDLFASKLEASSFDLVHARSRSHRWVVDQTRSPTTSDSSVRGARWCWRSGM
jgi:ubiquinone/menaquinone biosynthesis C-methylase UbiE